MNLTKKKWSFSSIKLFETCKYAFYLKYIEDNDEEPNAFSQHGSLVHSILERYFNGELYAFELADIFEKEYETAVTEKFPFFAMYKGFYEKTLEYLQNFDGIDGEVLGVEQKFDTTISGYKFIGFADLIIRDDKGIVIYDHKSHGKWKSKKERAEYFRQLYIYAYCVKELYGELPYKLVFNRFRIPDEPLDEELFNKNDYNSAIKWFTDSIDEILATDEWDCNVDNFYCGSLCRLGCCYEG